MFSKVPWQVSGGRPIPKYGPSLLNLVKQHCHGYANGCECPNCAARTEGVEAGALYYDGQGRLRYKGREQAVNGQAIVSYRRDRDKRTLKAAA